MAIPKNTDIKTLAFGGSSLLGAILAGYAYTGGRLSSQFPEAYFLNFVVFAFGVYGIAFIAAPKFLLEENVRAHSPLGTACASCYLPCSRTYPKTCVHSSTRWLMAITRPSPVAWAPTSS